VGLLALTETVYLVPRLAMNKRHGMSDTPTYHTWEQMRQRCNDRNCKDFKWYGARGIRVCKRWNSFSNFLADMGVRPEGTSLDRKNNDGHYCKRNCRWADKFQQKHNRSDNVLLTYKGDTLPRMVWARRIGMHPETLRHRLMRGWSVKRTFETPVQRIQR
jgi:hypothetical protein